MDATDDFPFQNSTLDDFYRGDDRTVDNIAVMDSPREDCITLYYARGELRFPCRDVNYTKFPHFNEVLNAWATKAPLLDERTDKTVPLP